jgi:hypothetical protein
VDFHTHGLSYAIEPHDGIYLIADVAKVIEQTNGHHKGKQAKSDVIKKYNKILDSVWADNGYSGNKQQRSGKHKS